MGLQMGLGSNIASPLSGKANGVCVFSGLKKVTPQWLTHLKTEGNSQESWETPPRGLKPCGEGRLGNEGAVPVGNLSGLVSHGHLTSSDTSADGIAEARAVPTIAAPEMQFSFTWSAHHVLLFPVPEVWGAASGHSQEREPACVPLAVVSLCCANCDKPVEMWLAQHNIKKHQVLF